MDPSDVPTFTTSPTFEETACTLLGQDLCSGMDPISAIDELGGLVTAMDELSTAADAQLDAILLELDQLGQDKVEQAYGDFAGAQPGAESLLGGVTSIAAPALGQVPMVLPNGQATITFGAPPALGGVPHAGSPPYTLHLPVTPVSPGIHSIAAQNLGGPNPPFVSAGQGFVQEESGGRLMWVALITINPAAAGAFSGVLYYQVGITITGLTGTLSRTLPFQIVVGP